MFKKLFTILIFSLWLLNPTLAFAQSTNTPLPEYSGVEQSISSYLCTPSDPPDGQDLVRCINKIYRFGITAGALVLVLMLIVAGYIYITSGESGKGKAKGILMNSVVGMGILIGSYALLYFINPDLTTFKPVQPPIFEASLPDCGEIGFSDDCITDEDEDLVIARSGGGSAIPCPDGLIKYDPSVPARPSPTSAQICKAFMQKLIALHARHKITVTSTIRGSGTVSQCHMTNTTKSGACADIVSNSGDWNALCQAIKEVGGLGFLNESGSSYPNCGKFVKTKYWTGAHLHVNLTGR